MKKNRLLLLFAVGQLLISLSAFAVVNGEPALEKKYSAVGSLKIGHSEEVGCTATLIDSRWIITADHCTNASEESEEEGGGDLLPPSDYEFRIGDDFYKPKFRVQIKRWVNRIEYNGEVLDIALGELAQEVPVSELNISPIPMLSQNWTSQDLSDDYIHIGFGTQIPFQLEPTPLYGKRQKAHFKITNTSGNALLKIFGSESALESYLNNYHPQSLESNPLDSIVFNGELIPKYSIHAWDPRGRQDFNNVLVPPLGWQDTCFGDSGGPLLREIDGQQFVVGVVSQGMDRICTPIGTRFTVFGPMIHELRVELGI